MNISRLLAIKEAILKQPERYDQTTFLHETCNSACCIGGWADILFSTSEQQEYYDVEANAIKNLDLTAEESRRLFYGYSMEDMRYYPHYERFSQLWDVDLKSYASQKYAQIGAERIDWFIKTNGTDLEKDSK